MNGDRNEEVCAVLRCIRSVLIRTPVLARAGRVARTVSRVGCEKMLRWVVRNRKPEERSLHAILSRSNTPGTIEC
jgi:hypothetical protein